MTALIFFVIMILYINQHMTWAVVMWKYEPFCQITLPTIPPPTTGRHVAPTPGLLEDKYHTFHEILQLQSCQHICGDDSRSNGGATVAGGPSVSRGTTQELYWEIWTEAKGRRHQCMDQLPTTEAHGRFHRNILWRTISHCTMPLISPGMTLWLSDSTPCWDNEGACR